LQPVTVQPLAGQPTVHSPPAQSISHAFPSWHRTLHEPAPSHFTAQLSDLPHSALHVDAPAQWTVQSPEEVQSTRQSSSLMQLA
jgi:hypothetical protein